MPRLRISLAGSLGIVAVIAMGLAGMVSASSLWTTAAATVTLALLLMALLAARLLDGLDRAFWAGFALFGWSYLILVNWDWIGGQFGHDLTAGLSDVAEALFEEIEGNATPPPTVPPPRPSNIVIRSVKPPSGAVPPGGPMANPTPPPASAVGTALQLVQLSRQRQIKLGNFVQIGRMLLALIFGLAGGLIARAMAHSRSEAAAMREPPSPAGRSVRRGADTSAGRPGENRDEPGSDDSD